MSTAEDIVKATEELQKVTPASSTGKWISLALALATVVGAPVTTAVFSHCQQKRQTYQTRHEQTIRQQQDRHKLQVELFARVIGVAEKAKLQDPTSMFQLGLIAQMVNENQKFFGIELQDAEQQYRGMFDRLAPISGLRKRLAETNAIITTLKRDLEVATIEEKKLDAEITELRTERKALGPEDQWRRDNITKQINRKTREVHQHRVVRRFSVDRLKIEENFLKFFTAALEQQTTELNQALAAVADARNKATHKTLMLKAVVSKLQDDTSDKTVVWRDFWTKVQDIMQDHDRLRGSIERLQAELASEQTAYQTCDASLQLCLQTCRKRNGTTAPSATSPATTGPAATSPHTINVVPQPRVTIQRKQRPAVEGLFRD